VSVSGHTMTPTKDHVDPGTPRRRSLGKPGVEPYRVPLDSLRRGWRAGVAIQTSYDVPRGMVERTRIGAQMHPSDWMRLRNNGRTPLWTRNCVGVREAERDRRRHGR
jgi:hypothetical protein